MAKNTRIKQKRRAVRRRRERLAFYITCAFMVFCLGTFASLGLLNANSAKHASDQWIVAGQGAEVMAPAMGTLENRRDGGAAAVMPAIVPTATPSAPRPTQAPLLTPAPTAEPTATIEPTAEPTATPKPGMPTLQPETELRSVLITAVGDCTLGGDIPSGNVKYFASYYDKYGPDYFLENVRPIFEQDDLTIVNLEGPLTTSKDMRSGRAFNFRGKPEYVSILKNSSVELCNVANNHAMDFGEKGFNETMQVLENAGIGYSGFSHAWLGEINGVKVCSLGFTQWAYNEKQIRKTVELARKNCELLIVSIHWGEEGNHQTTSTQKRLGHLIIDAGADVVLGTHTHVYGGVEQYKGKNIIYSLGNFCFGGNKNPSNKDCLIYQQKFLLDENGTVMDGGINMMACRVSSVDNKNDYKPTLANDKQTAAVVKGVRKVSTTDLSQFKWMAATTTTAEQ